jgi:hypothetical protein
MSEVTSRKPDFALGLVFGVVVFGLSLWHSLFIAHGCYGNYGLILHPGRLLVLTYITYVAIRRAHVLPGMIAGALAATVWVVPWVVGSSLGGTWGIGDIAQTLLVAVTFGASLGAVLATLSWLVRLLWRRITGRLPKEPAPEPCSTVRPGGWLLVSLVLMVAALFVDSVGLSLERDLYDPLSHWIINERLWRGWLDVFKYERALPIALGGLACWSLLRRRRWAGRATAVYLIVAAVLTVARFAAFRYLHVDDTPPLPTEEWEWSVYEMPLMRFTALDDVTLVEAVLRLAACAVGIPYLLRSRRVRDWLKTPGSQGD